MTGSVTFTSYLSFIIVIILVVRLYCPTYSPPLLYSLSTSHLSIVIWVFIYLKVLEGWKVIGNGIDNLGWLGSTELSFRGGGS